MKKKQQIDLQYFKKKLLEERKKLLESEKKLEKEKQSLVLASSSIDRITYNEEDSTNVVVDVQEIGRINVLKETISRQLEQIDLALVKIKKKKYGKCEICNQPISITRLKAIPYATLCIKCQEKKEKEI